MRVSGPQVLPSLLVALLFVAGLPSGSGIPNDPDNHWADIQGIAVGDFWDFRVSGQENGDIHNVVAAKELQENSFEKTIEAYRIDATGILESKQRPRDNTGTGIGQNSDATVTIEVDISKWVRMTDYAVHHIQGTTTIEGKEVESRESFDPPFVEVVYPFQEGYKWRSRSSYELKRGGEDQQDDKFTDVVEVLGKEQVTVPAGTFTAWKLNFTSGRDYSEYKLQWYVEEVCEIVKEDRYGNDGKLINRMELMKYSCSKTEKENPAYDPQFVALLAVGEPWVDDSGNTQTPTQFGPNTADANGLSFWWVALAFLAIGGAVLFFIRRR